MSDLRIDFYHYNAEECLYLENPPLSECAAFDRVNYVNWLNIYGVKNQVDLQEAAEIFKIHPLVIEDIVHTEQRAKIEDYGDFYFVVLRMFALRDNVIEDQQVSFIVKDNLLLTFRESDFGIFKKQLGDKLVNGGSLRKMGEDFLLYKLLDLIIDNYYFVLEHIGSRLERFDNEIMVHPTDLHVVQLQRIRGELLYLRKYILPVRELINVLQRNEIEYFNADNKYYLRDMHDHMQRNVEEIDFQREQLNSLMDFYYQLQTHKMNNVMKTLTIVSFIFLPLTFVASLYGMNFTVIPRADDPRGFWELLVGMGVLATILIVYAFSRKWLSTKDFLKDKL